MASLTTAFVFFGGLDLRLISRREIVGLSLVFVFIRSFIAVFLRSVIFVFFWPIAYTFLGT